MVIYSVHMHFSAQDSQKKIDTRV